MSKDNVETTSNRSGWLRYGIWVAGIHGLGFMFLLLYAHQVPQLLGMGFIAYTLGMRHAFDADHIAAIDNTVRKLTQQKSDSLGTGFFFSLGHSSVVFFMTLAAAIATHLVQQKLPQIQQTGALIGTVLSGVFLLFIGILNLYIWFDLYRMFRRMRVGGYDSEKFEALLLSRGLLARFVGPLYGLINKSWHIYPVGFLFGLGFDTASEVILLAMSVGAVNQAIPMFGILSLPILFAAGMSLMDTADGIFMTKAYDWAFATPLRKVYYNLSVTGLSVMAAMFIGMVELAQVLVVKLRLQGAVWVWLKNLDFGQMGYVLVVLFLLAWGVSYGAWKLLRLED